MQVIIQCSITSKRMIFRGFLSQCSYQHRYFNHVLCTNGRFHTFPNKSFFCLRALLPWIHYWLLQNVKYSSFAMPITSNTYGVNQNTLSIPEIISLKLFTKFSQHVSLYVFRSSRWKFSASGSISSSTCSCYVPVNDPSLWSSTTKSHFISFL